MTRRAARCVAAAGMLFGLLAVPADARPGPERGSVVLVRLDPAASPAQRARVAHVLGARSARGLPGGWRAYRLPGPTTLSEMRAALQGASADRAVELDAPVTPLMAPDDPAWPEQWGVRIIGAPTAWSGPEGAPVVVAVTDTGVDIGHPDLAGRVWTNPGEVPGNGVDDDADGRVDDVHGWDVLNGDATVFDAPERDAHGTHVAGTIAAVAGNAFGIAGIAPNARVMPVKFMETGPDGGGTVSGAIAAIDYAVRHGARVVNASWGTGYHSQALCDAVQAAADRGVLVVAAAGNGGLDESEGGVYPAACPSDGLLSVTATDPADTLSAFANRGATTVDLGAPGTGIVSLAPGGGLATRSGTSMAAPHVTGVAALLLGRRPDLGLPTLVGLLRDTGVPLPSLAGTTVSGRRVDAVAALAALGGGVVDPVPPTPPAITSPEDGALVRTVRLEWRGATDTAEPVAAHRVLVDGVEALVVPGDQRAAVLTGVPDGPHRLTVAAEDARGVALTSEPVDVTVDGTPPADFEVLAGGLRAGAVRVRWTPSSDAGGLDGYRVRWDTGALMLPPTTTLMPFALALDDTLLVRVTAIDRAGNEREASRTFTAAPPPPPSAVPGLTVRRAMCRHRARAGTVRARRCLAVSVER